MRWKEFIEQETGEIPKELEDLREFFIRANKKIIVARYVNANYFAIAIVASVTYVDKKPIDWSAYIGATPSDCAYRQTVEYVWKRGVKLRERDARHFFPELKDVPYRP